MLSLAAVIGHDFDLALLGTVSGLPEDHLLDALDEATAAAVAQEVPGQSARFTFSHSLIQHVLYDELSALRRVRAHQRVAAALETLYGDEPGEHVAELARHSVAATRPVDVLQTIHYARRAGDRALAHLAPEEAVAWYLQALELHDTLPAVAEDQRAELLIDLGEAQRRAGQPAFRETLLEAAAVARRLGDTDRLVRAALANNRGLHSVAGISDSERVAVLQEAVDALGDRDSSERARLLAALAAELTYSGEWERRRALAAEALSVARQVGDDATVARVLNVRHSALQVPECAGELLQNTTENLDITARLGDPLERFWALQYRVWAVGAGGGMDEAEERLAELDSWVEALGQPALGWYARFHRSWCELLAGRIGESTRSPNRWPTIPASPGSGLCWPSATASLTVWTTLAPSSPSTPPPGLPAFPTTLCGRPPCACSPPPWDDFSRRRCTFGLRPRSTPATAPRPGSLAPMSIEPGCAFAAAHEGTLIGRGSSSPRRS